MRVDQLERGLPVDVWLLKDHDMYRMLITKDENCLYRAIAEQECAGQNYFGRVKNKLTNYCATQDQDFESLETLEGKMKAISGAFEKNIVLYKDLKVKPERFGEYEETTAIIRLRYDKEDGSYESIHPILHMSANAICQSLVYEALYEKVFDISKEEQQKTVQKVRQKVYNYNQTHKQSAAGGGHQTASSNFSDTSGQSSDTASSPRTPQKTNEDQDTAAENEFPPFPFRVAKSLDPAFYRNAQYDIWLDALKEKDKVVQLGDYVTVNRDGTSWKGHVQDIISDDKILVYIEAPNNGGRVTINRSEISKISNRKSPANSSSKAGAKLRAEGRNKSYISPQKSAVNSRGSEGPPMNVPLFTHPMQPQPYGSFAHVQPQNCPYLFANPAHPYLPTMCGQQQFQPQYMQTQDIAYSSAQNFQSNAAASLPFPPHRPPYAGQQRQVNIPYQWSYTPQCGMMAPIQQLGNRSPWSTGQPSVPQDSSAVQAHHTNTYYDPHSINTFSMGDLSNVLQPIASSMVPHSARTLQQQ